jgi:hypothetical protein
MRSNEFDELVKISRNMQSLVMRLENQGLHTSRDTSDLRSHIVSITSRIDFTLDAISRSLTVLHDRIESIAQSQETLRNLVLSQVNQCHATNSLQSLPLTPVMVEEALPDSPENIQVRSPSPDINCSETIFASSRPFHVQILESDGSMDNLEWENLDELMKNYQSHM